MRVFVGRPEPDAQKTADALRASGHSPVVAPLFAIEPRATAVPVGAYDGVIATSANALRMLPADNFSRLLALPLFAVGDATADAARDLGFSKIMTGGRDARELAQVIARQMQNGANLLRLAGAERNDDAFATLPPAILIETIVTYASVAVSRIPAVLEAALRDQALDAALHFLPRGAKIFADLCDQAGLGEAYLRLTHVCISEAAAEPRLRNVRVAEAPTLSAMIAAL